MDISEKDDLGKTSSECQAVELLSKDFEDLVDDVRFMERDCVGHIRYLKGTRKSLGCKGNAELDGTATSKISVIL